MTNEERIAYLLDKLAACERDSSALIADLRKQVTALAENADRLRGWWMTEKDAHAAADAKLAALEGGAK